MRNLALMCVLAVVFAVLGLSISCKSRDARQDADAAWADMPPDTAASDTMPPLTALPVLTIGGKENRDVYLQSLDIVVEVTGNIASTRYTMVFKNRTNRVLEGELTFPLPDGRSATHYALDVNGRMREAVPVEKSSGTQVFEEIEQRRPVVDPGLLERVEGSNLRTRVYPIPANGKRTVSIGYEEELTLERGLLYYRLPMAYPDSLEKFAVKATVFKSGQMPLVPKSDDEIHFDTEGEDYVASLSRENYRPARALIFALPAPAGIPRVLMQPAQGNYYFLASVAPQMPPRKKQWANDLAIVWDVSLSGSQRDLRRDMEILDVIFADRKNANAHLYFLSNKNIKQGDYKVIGGNWEKLKNVLEAAVFDGGTDFSKIDLNNIAGDEILLFSDGISTLSDADFLKNNKTGRPVHCVVSSVKADYSAMKLIAGGTKGKFINTNALSSEQLRRELLYETQMFMGIEQRKGVRDSVLEVYPSIATPFHGNFSVAGISAEDEAELTLLFGFGNKVEKRIKVRLDAASAANQGNTYKIWAQKKIAELDLEYEKNRAELTGLGKQFGIVTRNTSLIVLESVDDYVLYGIEPPASESTLRLQYRYKTRGVEKSRSMFGLGFSSGAGGFATDIDAILSGVGGRQSGGDGGRRAGIGYGSGYGSGFGGGGGGINDLLGGLMGGGSGGSLRKVSSPDFIKGASLTGGRSRANVQRVIQQNIPPLRYAYNRRLRDNPGLEGKITVNFAIDEFGKVIFAQVVKSTVNDAELENSIVDRVKNWNFDSIDKPGDVTEVTYPFAFSQNVEPATTAEETAETRERIARAMEENAQAKKDAIARAMNGDGTTQKKREEAARQRERADRERVEWEKRIEQERKEEAVRERERAARQKEYAIDYALNGAVSAAARIKTWWNTNVTAPQFKYPAPDAAAAGIDSTQKPKPKYPTPDGINPAVGGFAKGKDYLNGLTGKLEDDYQTYLKLRNGHANSPAYYYDMADWFFTRGDRETALRVLTSIADLELENASLYRLLGYRFKEYGEYGLEKFVCQKVVKWRPIEPQSYRDYALALADNGEAQEALDSLCALLEKPYSNNIRDRSRGVAEAVVMEINNLIDKRPDLNTSKINARLIMNVPVDIRVVVNWNMDNTDIDLHVTDPSGEECYYGRRETRAGGRISTVPSGYGPEQFLLKNAIAGKYRVYVSYYSRREFADAGPYTIMAEVYTKYADKTEQRKIVSLQMSNVNKRGDGKVQVAEFSF